MDISSLSFDTFFSLADARDREQLTRNNITHILSIHDSAAPILPVRKHFPVDRSLDQNG